MRRAAGALLCACLLALAAGEQMARHVPPTRECLSSAVDAMAGMHPWGLGTGTGVPASAHRRTPPAAAATAAAASGRCSANPRTRPASSPAAVGHGRQLTATDPYAPKTCPTNMVYENIYDAAYCMKLTTTVLAINVRSS